MHWHFVATGENGNLRIPKTPSELKMQILAPSVEIWSPPTRAAQQAEIVALRLQIGSLQQRAVVTRRNRVMLEISNL